MNTVSILTMILCVVFMCFAIVGTIIRIKKNKQVDLVDWFVISSGAYNGLGIVLIMLELQNTRYAKAYFSSNSDVWLYPVFSLISVLGVWAGATIFRSNRLKSKGNKEDEKFDLTLYSKKIFRISWVFFIVGLFSYWIYVSPYGGFVRYLDYAPAVRAGLFDEVNVDRTWSFLKRFGGFSTFSSLLFVGLMFSYRSLFRVPLILWISFLVSFGFSLYVLYSWGGRLGLVTFLTAIVVGRYLIKYGYGYKFLARMLIPFIAVILLLPLSSGLWGKNKEVKPVAEFFVQEISFPLFVFEKAYEADKPRWMQDFILAPAYILPQRIWGGMLEMDTVSQISTKRVTGLRKGERRSTTGVPVDFVSFGIMEGGVIGVVLISLFFGYFFTKIDGWLFLYFRPGVREIMYGYLIFTLPIQLVLYSDPQHVIIRNFHFIVGFFVLRYFERKAIKRRKKTI